jgi:Na+/H+ antiporter NhaD/arsenite permease-like protein
MGAQLISALIFVGTFALILSEKAHRTIIAVAGASIMVIAGISMGFYSQEEALASIDFNTLGLLFGMMILVSMLARTGFFQYLATFTAKRSNGNPWYLLLLLGSVTTLLSMFLDNVTTIILIAPVTVLIAEILGISPVPLLIAEALLSDTGGVATLIGDPPNVMIGSAASLSFNDFLIHLAPIVIVAWLVALILLCFLFRRELAQKPSNIEALMKLDENAALHDRKSLIRILIVLGGVILLFFLHNWLHLRPAFVALLGASAALVWVQPNVDEVLRDVEWSVLLFFAALFATVGGLQASGLLNWLAEHITAMASWDLLLMGLALIWTSAILSAIVDNVPFTIVMIPLIQDLGATGINVTPLWWALALGAGFGGNGTPIGSTANVITIAISEKTQTPITARTWMKTGLPVMVATCIVGTILFVLTFKSMQ